MTLDDLQQQASVRCPECGTAVQLHPEDPPLPFIYEPQLREPLYFGVEF
jgi:hypothetical protein